MVEHRTTRSGEPEAMSTHDAPQVQGTDPLRSHVRTLALDYAELLPESSLPPYPVWSEAADVIQSSIEHAVRAEVESA